MKYFFVIIVFIHGLIHLLGFVKGSGLREVKELTLPVSGTMGILWLIAALLFLIYGISGLLNSKYAWIPGLMAVLISQVLIMLFWKDARFGTIPNLIILLVSIISLGSYRFQERIHQETTIILNRNKIEEKKILNENDIQNLPEPVKSWLYNSGAVGKPYITMGKAIQQAEMKMKPDQKNWMSARAVQYTTIDNPAFIWTVNVKMNSLINLQGRDKFENGKGEMLIKLNSLINVVNEKGDKLDEGTLQRYLGEMAWFPSLALSPLITWEQIDETTVKATMTYKGTSGSGTFHFNSDGDFLRFSAMRYMGNDPEAKKYEWIITADDYKTFEGIKVPSRMTATWKLENNDWTWLKLEIKDIRYNENERR